MIEKQERNIRRDSALFLLGVASLILIEVTATAEPVTTKNSVIHGLLFGCSVGILLSGVFRATNKQALTSTPSLGIGFAVGAMIDFPFHW
ncbi:hypothetical protein C499_06180 [Halogeometricum borinquense DSM 11551]|uniref:Uncharacterized protein n=1 Tax=Halogeometricum borinquense (strain ATCC 700274 / DSM 11551 / JCM 10706 / KCTC 4070 / PR3) TaxID=469382 RepID=L9UZ64_HALBP|nr:hypothetical protein C499_06180 [Halogeometricum borinquense DSM 11551]